MSIPLFVFPALYLVLVFVYFSISGMSIYHLVRFGFFDFVGKFNALLYIIVTALILFFTWLILAWQDIDWSSSVNLISS